MQHIALGRSVLVILTQPHEEELTIVFVFQAEPVLGHCHLSTVTRKLAASSESCIDKVSSLLRCSIVLCCVDCLVLHELYYVVWYCMGCIVLCYCAEHCCLLVLFAVGSDTNIIMSFDLRFLRMDLDLAVRVYRQVRDVAKVRALQSFNHIGEIADSLLL